MTTDFSNFLVVQELFLLAWEYSVPSRVVAYLCESYTHPNCCRTYILTILTCCHIVCTSADSRLDSDSVSKLIFIPVVSITFTCSQLIENFGPARQDWTKKVEKLGFLSVAATWLINAGCEVLNVLLSSRTSLQVSFQFPSRYDVWICSRKHWFSSVTYCESGFRGSTKINACCIQATAYAKDM